MATSEQEQKREICVRQAGRAVVYALDSRCMVTSVHVGEIGDLWTGSCAVHFSPAEVPSSPDSTFVDAIRTYVRGLLAGPLAVAIMKGQSEAEMRAYVGTDGANATTCCWSLPFPAARFEYHRLFTETVAVLRDGRTWDRVTALADALYCSGLIRGKTLESFLRTDQAQGRLFH